MISESQALKLAILCPEEYVNHNTKFLSRIYPIGMRVDSSGYNPQDLWNGVHSASLKPLNLPHCALKIYPNGIRVQSSDSGFVELWLSDG